MRINIMAFLFCLISPIVNAEAFKYDYPTLCDSTQKIIESLGKNYSEQLTWSGTHVNDKSVYSLWINEKTKAWTLLKMTAEVSCILGVGEESNLSVGQPV